MSRIATRERNNGEREQGSLMRKSGRGKRRGGRIGFGMKGVRSVLWKSKKKIDEISCGGVYGYLDIVQNLLKEDADMRSIIPVLADWKKGP